jgi:hypothetical protein
MWPIRTLRFRKLRTPRSNCDPTRRLRLLAVQGIDAASRTDRKVVDAFRAQIDEEIAMTDAGN